MLEFIFNSKIKIKVLRTLVETDEIYFNDLRRKINSGAGSLKKVIDFFYEKNIIELKRIGKRKLLISLNNNYKELLKKIFEIEKDFIKTYRKI
ncbi:hypothetical protein XO10_01315 [Marinitoga sp. 1135]|uniref:Transcriptional regulator n=1 Tax=Marinitoga piezophila (strain DSM 14283 / JCM 11233 / KA3) TaxID=443254 RepID=H2J3L2_MARPK|nr:MULTISPECIES: hypothetical protein [Marinitoga]AEX84656.1 hypothetical protein Marpi_0201 [Marinitoga piezophila KA3]APT75171.1 hypothetical protein LN42_01230 [Marinitoga sp. 1137]NUU94945.1 hypothetical protein [Marinitoga sp. 1135]